MNIDDLGITIHLSNVYKDIDTKWPKNTWIYRKLFKNKIRKEKQLALLNYIMNKNWEQK